MKTNATPDFTVDIYCGTKTLAATLVSLRVFTPRYDPYCQIRVHYYTAVFSRVNPIS